jgi:hypothetical protein
VICPDCFGSNVFCEACGGSGVRYCCDGENVDMAPDLVHDRIKAAWAEVDRRQQDERGMFDWEALQRLRKTSAY